MRIIVALALALMATPALARAPAPGTEDYEIMAPFAQAIHDLHIHGLWCCDVSDGRPVDARRGGKSPTGWQVRFRPNNDIGAPADVWIDVPAEAMDKDAPPNPIGVPIAWWIGNGIRCFWPGSEI